MAWAYEPVPNSTLLFTVTNPAGDAELGNWMIAERVRWESNARLISVAPDLLAALKAASGYLLNAKIDLETGAPKRTAIATIEGGLKLVREAIGKAEQS
jgi:hypothetical protein